MKNRNAAQLDAKKDFRRYIWFDMVKFELPLELTLQDIKLEKRGRTGSIKVFPVSERAKYWIGEDQYLEFGVGK